MKCPECGHEVSTSAAACSNCGAPMKLGTVPESPAADPPPPPSPPVVVSSATGTLSRFIQGWVFVPGKKYEAICDDAVIWRGEVD